MIVVAALYFLTAGRFEADVMELVNRDPNVVAARIAPVGSVKLTGEASAQAAPAAAEAAPTAAAAGGKSGEEVYNAACVACHAAGVAGAPKLGDAEAWKPRIALGIDALLTTAINGKGAMPPKGTCMACTDADLRAAIEYMVSAAQ